MPLALFRLRTLLVRASSASCGGRHVRVVLLDRAYLQLVLGYSPLQVGLGFLPGNLIMAASIGLSAKLVMRWIPASTTTSSPVTASARAPVDGSYVVDVLPSMILLGLGAGMASNPVLLAAMSDVEPQESGLASGIVNTSFMMGGALGLAILASVAASTNERSPRYGESNAAAHHRLPRGVPDRCAVRPRRRGDRRPPPSNAPAMAHGEGEAATEAA